MKRNSRALWIIAVAIILTGCEGPVGPEGPRGPAGEPGIGEEGEQGPPGEDGQDGSDAIAFVELHSVAAEEFDFSGGRVHIEISVPRLTEELSDSGAVFVHVSPDIYAWYDWEPLPFNRIDFGSRFDWRYRYHAGLVWITVTAEDDDPSSFRDENVVFKIIVMEEA